MTPADLNTLARDIAEAAAKCVGAERALSSAAVGGDSATATAAVVARAGNWRADYIGPVGKRGADEAALNSAAVLALRDRVVAQREERARMLRADKAALKAIDTRAGLYDEATVREACAVAADPSAPPDLADRIVADLHEFDPPPWSRAQVHYECGWALDACDAILRCRAGTP